MVAPLYALGCSGATGLGGSSMSAGISTSEATVSSYSEENHPKIVSRMLS